MIFKVLYCLGMFNLSRVVGKHTERKWQKVGLGVLLPVLLFLLAVSAFGAPIRGIIGIAVNEPPVTPIPDTVTQVTTNAATLNSLNVGSMFSTGGLTAVKTVPMKSLDKGVTWSELSADDDLVDLYEVSGTGTLIAIQHVISTWKILRSVDGGITFSTILSEVTSGVSPAHRLIVADSSGNIYISIFRKILKSTNDGISFTTVDSGTSQCTGVGGIAINSDGTIIVVGDTSFGCGSPPSPMVIRVSTNSGSTWSSVTITTGWSVSGYWVPHYSSDDSSFLISVERDSSIDTGYIYRSTDALTWALTTSPPTFFNRTILGTAISTFGNPTGTYMFLATNLSGAGNPVNVWRMQLPNGAWSNIGVNLCVVSTSTITPIVREVDDLYFGATCQLSPTQRFYKIHD